MDVHDVEVSAYDSVDVRRLQPVVPGVHPVELVVGVVYGESVRPSETGGDDGRRPGAVHRGTHDGWSGPPVSPEHQTKSKRDIESG